MLIRTDKQLHRSYAVLSVLLIFCVMWGCIGVATARYHTEIFTATVYGTKPTPAYSTLGAETTVYDWGDWSSDTEEDPTATIVFDQQEPLRGVLQFSFDRTTEQVRDVFLFSDWGVPSTGGMYTVRDEDGHVELPFSVLITDRERSGQIVLDVAWTPEGEDTPTLTSRYLLTLQPQQLCGVAETPPSFGSTTEFLTDRLLHLSLQPPATASGVMLTNGSLLSDTFAAGLRYYTKQYPQGVLLLHDSTVYLPTDGSDTQEILLDIDRKGSTAPVKIGAGAAEGYLATTTQTPAAAATSLQISTEGLPLVSATRSWTVTVTEAAVFRDAMWNNRLQEGAQLTFTLERLTDGRFVPVEPNGDLTFTVAQTENGGTVTVAAPTAKQPAGTYQLRIEQAWYGYSLYSDILTFFIDYRG